MLLRLWPKKFEEEGRESGLFLWCHTLYHRQRRRLHGRRGQRRSRKRRRHRRGPPSLRRGPRQRSGVGVGARAVHVVAELLQGDSLARCALSRVRRRRARTWQVGPHSGCLQLCALRSGPGGFSTRRRQSASAVRGQFIGRHHCAVGGSPGARARARCARRRSALVQLHPVARFA